MLEREWEEYTTWTWQNRSDESGQFSLFFRSSVGWLLLHYTLYKDISLLLYVSNNYSTKTVPCSTIATVFFFFSKIKSSLKQKYLLVNYTKLRDNFAIPCCRGVTFCLHQNKNNNKNCIWKAITQIKSEWRNKTKDLTALTNSFFRKNSTKLISSERVAKLLKNNKTKKKASKDHQNCKLRSMTYSRAHTQPHRHSHCCCFQSVISIIQHIRTYLLFSSGMCAFFVLYVLSDRWWVDQAADGFRIYSTSKFIEICVNDLETSNDNSRISAINL